MVSEQLSLDSVFEKYSLESCNKFIDYLRNMTLDEWKEITKHTPFQDDSMPNCVIIADRLEKFVSKLDFYPYLSIEPFGDICFQFGKKDKYDNDTFYQLFFDFENEKVNGEFVYKYYILSFSDSKLDYREMIENINNFYELILDDYLPSLSSKYKSDNKDLYVGAIYIFVNPVFQHLVKIGYSDNVEKRMEFFNSNSGLPDPYHCFAIYKVKKRLDDLKLHRLIDSLNPLLRHSVNREFYEMDVNMAYSILNTISQINGDTECLIKNPFNDSWFDKNLKTVC